MGHALNPPVNIVQPVVLQYKMAIMRDTDQRPSLPWRDCVPSWVIAAPSYKAPRKSVALLCNPSPRNGGGPEAPLFAKHGQKQSPQSSVIYYCTVNEKKGESVLDLDLVLVRIRICSSARLLVWPSAHLLGYSAARARVAHSLAVSPTVRLLLPLRSRPPHLVC
jgi:hypothetical protein